MAIVRYDKPESIQGSCWSYLTLLPNTIQGLCWSWHEPNPIQGLYWSWHEPNPIQGAGVMLIFYTVELNHDRTKVVLDAGILHEPLWGALQVWYSLDPGMLP